MVLGESNYWFRFRLIIRNYNGKNWMMIERKRNQKIALAKHYQIVGKF